jgi:hypothetical protein
LCCCLDACTDEKDSGLSDYFEVINRSRKIAPAVIAAALSACATETVLLNSERIERQFGSYGIDVLASEAGLLRSSLYSLDNGEHICRTYAVVRFTEELDTSYGPLHAKVLAGNSLGEVFKENVWSIHKQTLHIGAFEIDQSASEIARLMRLAENRTLALHVYQLLLARDEQVFEYATIIEAHHPDYLSQESLLDIYHYDEEETLSAESISQLIELLLSNNNG